jgi:hypothetical protein
LTKEEDEINLDINDESACLEISCEFIEKGLPELEAMLRDILLDQKIKEVKINIKTRL